MKWNHLVAIVLALFILAGCARPPVTIPAPVSSTEPVPTKISETPSTASAVAKVITSVVYITAAYGRWHASGTGVFINKDGYILTNNHVVEKGYYATVFLPDRKINAEIVYRDPKIDIAILKCPSGSYPATTLGSSKSPTLGEDVIAIGFPSASVLGDSPSISKGIISALRTIGGVKYIQTDASLNPGSSGGPLINIRGEVVGINTWKLTQSEGISFAIDVGSIKAHIEDVVQQLINGSLSFPSPPLQEATVPSKGVVFQYHGSGTTPPFSISSSPWKLFFKPEFDGRVMIWASETSNVNDMVRIFGTNYKMHLDVTAGRIYETYIYSLTGNSVVLGQAGGATIISSGRGDWTVWVVEEPISVSSPPFTYTGEGEVRTPPLLLKESTEYKMNVSTTWDGDISIGWYDLENKPLLSQQTYHFTKSGKKIEAGITYEYIFTWKYTTQATYLSIEWAPPLSNWMISISEASR